MLKEAKKIAIVIGTKAELIKCMPIMVELQKRGRDYHFIHTGQHPLGKSCEEFGIKKPDFILSKEPTISTKFWSKINKISIFWFISMIFKINKMLKKLKPRYVIYHGDTMSTAAASIGSSNLINFRKNWKNVHLEAGLRSGSLLEPFPEEISRIISDKFSDILFAVSERSKKNVEKYSDKIVINTGNTIVDAAWIARNKVNKNNNEKNYALINLHRHENLINEKRMKNITEILKSVKSKAIWPLHDNTAYHLKKYGLMEEIIKIKNIKITPLVNYQEFIFLLSNCKYLITDGGSIQEESLVFNKPCVILRKKTERQEGLITGINFLTGVNINSSKRVIEMIENNLVKNKKFKNPYGEKGLSKKIIDLLN